MTCLAQRERLHPVTAHLESIDAKPSESCRAAGRCRRCATEQSHTHIDVCQRLFRNEVQPRPRRAHHVAKRLTPPPSRLAVHQPQSKEKRGAQRVPLFCLPSAHDFVVPVAAPTSKSVCLPHDNSRMGEAVGRELALIIGLPSFRTGCAVDGEIDAFVSGSSTELRLTRVSLNSQVIGSSFRTCHRTPRPATLQRPSSHESNWQVLARTQLLDGSHPILPFLSRGGPRRTVVSE